MDTNKMREQFEVWVKARWPETEMGKFNTGEYHGFTLEHCWKAWQASREAVVVELPRDVDQFADDDPGRRAFSLHTNTAYRECRRAIEAQGLKVTP